MKLKWNHKTILNETILNIINHSSISKGNIIHLIEFLNIYSFIQFKIKVHVTSQQERYEMYSFHNVDIANHNTPIHTQKEVFCMLIRHMHVLY